MAARKISDADLGWLVGLFDGEGCVGYKTSGYGNGRRLQVRLTVAMTSLPAVGKICDLWETLGAKVNWHESTLPSGKPLYYAMVDRRESVRLLIDTMLPLALAKRADLEAASDALAIVEAEPRGGRHASSENRAAHEKACSLICDRIGVRQRRKVHAYT